MQALATKIRARNLSYYFTIFLSLRDFHLVKKIKITFNIFVLMRELDFDPLPFLDNPHWQTVVGSQINLHREPVSKEKRVLLPDGDRISLQITTPKGWQDKDLTVFMVHGLCGSHQSNYLIRLAQKFEGQNIRAIRYNMRGCGSGRGHPAAE